MVRNPEKTQLVTDLRRIANSDLTEDGGLIDLPDSSKQLNRIKVYAIGHILSHLF